MGMLTRLRNPMTLLAWCAGQWIGNPNIAMYARYGPLPCCAQHACSNGSTSSEDCFVVCLAMLSAF